MLSNMDEKPKPELPKHVQVVLDLSRGQIIARTIGWMVYLLLPLIGGWFEIESGLYFRDVAMQALSIFGYGMLGSLAAYAMADDDHKITYLVRGIGLSFTLMVVAFYAHRHRVEDWLDNLKSVFA